MTIGSVRGAREALAGDLTYIGEGCYRSAYVDYETSTVYKIENDEGNEWAANNAEWATYTNRRFLNLPKGYRIPTMRLIVVDNIPIIATRFIIGIKMGDCYCTDDEKELRDHANSCLPADISMALANEGIDGSWGNIIFDGTTHWIVDAQ